MSGNMKNACMVSLIKSWNFHTC